MHTNQNKNRPVALFLFAHQDDEFGVFYEIEKSIELNYRVICLFLTDGSYGAASPETRNSESYRILTKLGVNKNDIWFLGSLLCIKDSKLCYSLLSGLSAVKKILSGLKIASIYCPAWEGGHPDHDALYLIAATFIEHNNIQAICWQYSLYNGKGLSYPFFRVLRPLDENGRAESKRIPLRKRLKYLLYCASYRSQIKSWIGLWPLVLWHYVTNGRQYLQPVTRFTNYRRPHQGPLYYEKRAFMTWSEFERVVKLSNHLETPLKNWKSR